MGGIAICSTGGSLVVFHNSLTGSVTLCRNGFRSCLTAGAAGKGLNAGADAAGGGGLRAGVAVALGVHHGLGGQRLTANRALLAFGKTGIFAICSNGSINNLGVTDSLTYKAITINIFFTLFSPWNSFWVTLRIYF